MTDDYQRADRHLVSIKGWILDLALKVFWFWDLLSLVRLVKKWFQFNFL